MSAERRKGADSGRPAAGPARLCAVLRVQRAPEDLIRFAVSPQNQITPDLACALPGRGVWVSATRDMVAKAVATRAFARSLKRPVDLPDNLPGLVEDLLVRQVCAALALSNKAGLVVSGFTKVEAAMARGGLAALIHGADSAEDGAAKLDRRFRAIEAERDGKPQIIGCLAIAELSLALGRPNVVHAGLAPGGASAKFLHQAGRLQHYRSELDTSSTVKAPQVAKVGHG